VFDDSCFRSHDHISFREKGIARTADQIAGFVLHVTLGLDPAIIEPGAV